ncbi:MAG TPA: creatininase family protein [Planctomycetaceae bacterium]|nr:creatininase family protein [Planctomycetaceae bacterium]
MTARPYILAETTWETVRQTAYEVAILPWGATEAHNRHLPYATDTIQCDAVAAEAARLAWEAGTKTVVFPTVPYGVNTGQREIPFCLNMNPSTQQAVLMDIAETVQLHGVKKLVILNGHGGNDFRQIIRELQPRLSLLICQVHWFRCVNPAPYFTTPGDHAGELETSVMMEIAPDLVRPLSEAGPGQEHPFRIRGLREGWAWTQRRWVDATDDTGTGNPYDATREKGRKFLDAVSQQIAGFLVDLVAADITKLHE